MPFIDADPGPRTLVGEVEWNDTEEFYEPLQLRRQTASGQGYLRLTDDLVQSALPSDREAWWRDIEIDHLALRIRSTGGKSWYYLPNNGVSCREFLGKASDYTVCEARKKAVRAAHCLGQEEEGGAKANLHRKSKSNLRRNMRLSQVIAEYFNQHPPRDRAWFKTVESLFNFHVLSRYGDQMLGTITKAQWSLVVDKAALTRPSRGVNLHKALVTFLYWATKNDLIDANPLARTKPPTLPERLPIRLSPTELRSIYDAAQMLGAPWSVMVGLTMITGEKIEDIRNIQDRNINWQERTWSVERKSASFPFSATHHIVSLGTEALALLAPSLNVKGYFFQSPRSSFPRPINFYAEVIVRLKNKSKVDKGWDMKDLRGKAARLQRVDIEDEDVTL